MVENKLYKKNDILVNVKTKKNIIIRRLKNRGNYNKKLIKILKSQQINTKKKSKLCNFTIENNLGRNNILKQIKKIKIKLND